MFVTITITKFCVFQDEKTANLRQYVDREKISDLARCLNGFPGTADVCHPECSLPPSCMFSITGWLRLWDDGWGHKHSLSELLLRVGMSWTHSLVAINLVPQPLKPESNNMTLLQTEEEKRTAIGRASRGWGICGRKGKQAVHTDIKCTSEGRQEEALSEHRPGMSAYRREVSARQGERLQEDELMHEGGRENHLFLLLIRLDLCDNFKNNIRHK